MKLAYLGLFPVLNCSLCHCYSIHWASGETRRICWWKSRRGCMRESRGKCWGNSMYRAHGRIIVTIYRVTRKKVHLILMIFYQNHMMKFPKEFDILKFRRMNTAQHIMILQQKLFLAWVICIWAVFCRTAQIQISHLDCIFIMKY